MNFSEQISLDCNVSPSEKPQLDISVTKREPLTIAVPMTIFYSIIFLLGVWTVSLLDALNTLANFTFWITTPSGICDGKILQQH